ncbi:MULTISPECIES: hypothetical protein [Leptolyngbya]|uniref:hypothetical protein n=1 Tax=Leptolyngbya TaxID=47251 RepID=UPI00168654DD|nr:hypothetical protein [Leptolyngbya sp. FACHB-1624]MBD1859679.1 hypothetical protein [Leptolyngbya sp. FACHB-1624]
MLTDQHIAEAISRAYIRAIAGRAGLNLAIREYDYGVDGSFDEVVVRQNRRVRVRIPRSQRLTPESLLTLMENVKTGEW